MPLVFTNIHLELVIRILHLEVHTDNNSNHPESVCTTTSSNPDANKGIMTSLEQTSSEADLQLGNHYQHQY